MPNSRTEVEQVKVRSVRIPVQVTEAEKRKFEKYAEAKHTTLSEAIRQAMHQACDSENGKAA